MIEIFECKSLFDCSVEELFSFHEKSIGFDTLVGIDPNVKVLQKPNSILEGNKAILEVTIFPFIKTKWIAHHTSYKKNEFFIDEQEQGPFKKFKHYHIFQAANGNSMLIDRIEFDFYFLKISKYFILSKLKKQFKDRHKITAEKLNTKHQPIFSGLV